MNTFAITLNSAVSTLQILDKQARKDAGKVVRFTYGVYSALSSAEAKAHYRYAWKKAVQLAEIIGLIAIALISDLDRWIASHEVEAEVEAVETVAPVEVEPEISVVSVPNSGTLAEVVAPVKRRKSRKPKASSTRRLQQEDICAVNDFVPMTEIAM